MRARIALGGILLVASAAPAADWPPRDRNPVSAEKKPPTDWQIETDEAKPRNIKWVRQLGSYSAGGPVISNGLVWVGTNNERPLDPNVKGDHSVLACFRESDGAFLYQRPTPRGGEWNDWPKQGLSGTPLVDGDRLWFCTSRRTVVCLDIGPLRRGTGPPREVWQFDMPKEFQFEPFALHIGGHDTGGSPAAYKGWLFVPTGNGISRDARIRGTPDGVALACLRKDTGKLVWAANSPGPNLRFGHYSSPLVIEAGGRAQVIHAQGDGWVRSFDPGTGNLLWKFDPNPVGAKWVGDSEDGDGDGGRQCVVASPVLANGWLYFAHGRPPEASGGTGRLFCVDPTKLGNVSPEVNDGKGKGKPNPNSALVWDYAGGLKRADRMHLSLAPVAAHDGFVIASDGFGIVHCLDEKTGERHWSHDTKGSVYGGHLVADGKVYVVTQSGDAWILELAKVKKVVAKHELDDAVEAPPAFANGTLYLMGRGKLYAIAQKQ